MDGNLRGEINMIELFLSRQVMSWTPLTVALQASLYMGFSKQEYWSGLPFLSPEDLPDPGIEPWKPPALQAAFFFFYRLSYREVLEPQSIYLAFGLPRWC